MRLHFCSQNWGDRNRILEEHPNHPPKYEKCGIQVPLGRLKTRHYKSDKFNQGEERRLRCKTLQLYFEASRVSFQIGLKKQIQTRYGDPTTVLPKPVEILESVRNGREVDEKDGSNIAGPGSDV